MGETWKGPKLVLISSDQQFDPQNGPVRVDSYQGDELSIKSLAKQLSEAGVRCVIKHSGPIYSMDATFGEGDTSKDETPVDTYEIDGEFVQSSLWLSNKLFLICAGSFPTTPTEQQVQDRLAEWRRDIENAMKGKDTTGKQNEKGGPLSESESTFTGGKLSVYRLFVRGADSIEQPRPVLKRVRTVSPKYSKKITLDSAENIYTAKAIKELWEIPQAIIDQLPVSPGADQTPIETVWAWKIRRQSSTPKLREGRIEENIDFQFAAWSTVLYTLVKATGEL